MTRWKNGVNGLALMAFDRYVSCREQVHAIQLKELRRRTHTRAAGMIGARVFFGVIVPYAALLAFLAGVTFRVLRWAKSPVPFRIPTTCGQQTSLPWIKSSWLGNHGAGRVIVEALTFRTLWRNQQSERIDTRLVFGPSRLLWLAAFAFHWSLLVILVRHLRLFLNPVPGVVAGLIALDGFFRVGTPALYADGCGDGGCAALAAGEKIGQLATPLSFAALGLPGSSAPAGGRRFRHPAALFLAHRSGVHKSTTRSAWRHFLRSRPPAPALCSTRIFRWPAC